MNDELHQLLQRADANTPIPRIEAITLPSRVRRTARNQRRVAACGLAILALLPCTLLLFPHRQSVSIRSESLASLQIQIDLHARTAELLETAEHQPRIANVASDTFLADLQFQRNRAALVLLRDANRKLDDHDPLAARTLKRTVALFPETPAAASAMLLLESIHSSKEPS
jgi:hypothetical protein